jgi:hypothetical protein
LAGSILVEVLLTQALKSSFDQVAGEGTESLVWEVVVTRKGDTYVRVF